MSGERMHDLHAHGGADGAADNWLAAALGDDDGDVPSAQLWPRIERTHRRRRQRRRLLQGVSGVLLLGCLGGLVWQPWNASPGWRDAVDIAGSARPEVEATDATTTTQTARLRQIDRRLEAAYARGDDDAIDALWQRRERMLNTLEQEPDQDAQALLSL
jgi:hypothetical protein